MECNKNSKQLCGKCQICINRSIFGHIKGNLYSKDNKIDSKFVTQGSHTPVIWTCNSCFHNFLSKPYVFLKGKNDCPFCSSSPKRLCENNKNCQTCFNKSFASSERAHNVVDKSIDLTQIFLNCYDKCIFWCECGHEFSSVYRNITQGQWCPYCSVPPKKLCSKDKNCQTCFNKSFASSKRAHNVVDKTIGLTQIFLNRNKLCEFSCECGHEFTLSYNCASQGIWCSYCSIPPKKLCGKDKNCQTCFNKSFASSNRAKNIVDKSIDLTQIFLHKNAPHYDF